MGLAELPKELLQAILYHAVSVRGMQRGLRLRLVSKQFAAEVTDTIYTYRMLDRRFAQRLSHGQKSAMPPFTASYLEYRIHNAEEDSVPYPRLGFLRKIARDVVVESDSLQYGDCVRLLCRLIAEGGAARVYQVFCPALSLPTAFYEGDEEYVDTLFAAAVVTNTRPVVDRFISIYQERPFKSLLGSNPHEFFRLAVRYAEAGILETLLSGGQPYGVDVPRRNEMLIAAAAVGRLPALHLINCIRIEQAPWDFKDRTKRYASQRTLKDALSTPSKDVWDYVRGLREKYRLPNVIAQERKTKLLADCVQEGGDAKLVEHLLNLGADVDGKDIRAAPVTAASQSPILNACVNGYEDLVQILLSRGADTSCAIAVAAAHGHTSIVRVLLKHGATPFGGLLRAARGGYMDIARMLLDAGVDAGEVDDRLDLYPGLGRYDSTNVPIAAAVAMEHLDMVILLRERGAKVHGYAGRECFRVARKGLESMLNLLNEWNIDERG